MRKTITIILSLTFLLSLATISAAANGPVTIYTDQSLFLADTSATQIPFPEDADTALPTKPWSYLDHSCIDNNTGITLGDGDVVIKAPNANRWICFIGPDWNAPPSNTEPLPVNPTIVANGEDDYHVVDLDEPAHSIGFELLTNQNASETITLIFTDDTTHVIIDDDLGTDPNGFEFVGFKSDKLIKSVMIDTSGGAVQNEGISAIWVKENSPPTANPNGPYVGAVNTPISFDGSGSSDPDGDELTYTWDFGDGNNGTGVSPSNTYAAVGVYDVCLTVNDGFVDSDPVCTFAVVYDPSAGFVTGGGWIDSPPGAYKLQDKDEETIAFFNGFETDITGWDVFGAPYDAVRVSSGTNGISSATGDWHAEAGISATDWGGYNSAFPSGGYTTSIDIYLYMDGGFVNDTRFDWTSAINMPDGNHRRDFIFNGGFYNDNDGPGAGQNRFVFSASNNAPGWPKNPGRDPITVTTTGWYTLRHKFYDSGGGVLAVDLSIIDSIGNIINTWTLSDPTDIIGSTVGGNRYGWFVTNGFPFFAIDNSIRKEVSGPIGNANFGFVSKYKKGADVPTGNTEFQFHAADLNFHSTSYEWLVVTGSDFAKFKGIGTINGEGEYKFQVWAGDNDPDTFRIKIWYEENGSEVVVYDNGMNQEIGGGSIVVHTKN